jgi:lytic murein transglycosylase
LPDPDVIERTRKQAEFVKPIGDYLASAVSAKRIETGRAKAREWKETLEKVEHLYGVDPYVVLGVWGLETNFGGYVGDKYVIRALATLAYARYRGDYFKRELLSALQILQAGHVHAKDMQGSWAGAMGQTQFMPSSFNHYAVDFDGDGHKDIWTNVPDALASTANYLKKHGWIAGETWGYEVLLPSGFEASFGATQYRPFARWAAEGLARADGEAIPRDGEAALIRPAGAGGPAFLVTRNFKVIKTYNNSTAYALGVALLGDRVAGWPPVKGTWPVAAR